MHAHQGRLRRQSNPGGSTCLICKGKALSADTGMLTHSPDGGFRR